MAGSALVSSSELQEGDPLGDYVLGERLGEGGMGIVFRALRQEDGETVALKILKAELSHDEVYRRRFAHEARAAREVNHKHLVPVLDAGEAAGHYFMAASFVAGTTLEARLRIGGALPLPGSVRIASEIGAALDALHGHNLVHRDVKPSNIMLRNGSENALLTDFGLAKGPAYTVLTKKGQVMGTLDYLAPELIRGQPASPASDIYALGCVIYECLVGSAPFAAKSVFQVAMAHLEEDPPDPCAARQELPAEVGWALMAALEKEPSKRPSTATGYANLLRVAARAAAR